METNGTGIPLVVLGQRGRLRVQYAEGYPEKTIDVMLVANHWYEIDRSFRDEHNAMPPEKLGELQAAAVRFVSELLEVPVEKLTWAEANHLIAVLMDESRKLKDFFESISGSAPSSRASTELTFSVAADD